MNQCFSFHIVTVCLLTQQNVKTNPWFIEAKHLQQQNLIESRFVSFSLSFCLCFLASDHPWSQTRPKTWKSPNHTLLVKPPKWVFKTLEMTSKWFWDETNFTLLHRLTVFAWQWLSSWGKSVVSTVIKGNITQSELEATVFQSSAQLQAKHLDN